jgi:DNA sulfur modification protein DndC
MADSSNLSRSRQYLKNFYQQDNRPWVVAFSGGKDSTLVLQLICEMLLELGEQANKKIFVISSDTRVEAPNVSAYLARAIQALRDYAKHSAPNLEVHLVKPEVTQTFWSKLIGHGYPSPTRWFRWCTTNMKIKPSKKQIKNITDRFGSVILMLGTRIDENSDRANRIKAREYTHQGLNPHHEIPDALVATPIVHWTTDEVWDYLVSNNPPPWDLPHDFSKSEKIYIQLIKRPITLLSRNR